MTYHKLSIEERVTIQIGRVNGLSQCAIAKLLVRSPSTVSRELRRNRDAQSSYLAHVSHGRVAQRRQVCRPAKKLLPDSPRFARIAPLLLQRFSPEQIAGQLRNMKVQDFEDVYVCRETIYNAIYALTVGELHKELIICLCQSKPQWGR